LDLRAAYLDLLKRSLTDLLGAKTLEAVAQPNGTVKAMPLTDLGKRETGADWPMNGTTMVGLRRLDHLQRCIESIVAEGVDGDLIETGVWRGGASIFMRGVLASLDADRDLWVADSFEGLPKSKPEEYPADADSDEHFVFDYLSVSEDRVRAAFERYGLLGDKIRFLKGWFSDSLPPLKGTRQWSLLRLDGDMYESTIVALDSLYPDLSPGGFVVIDDYGAIPQCREAVSDFRRANGIEDPIEMIDWTGASWRRSA
jgi:O-methyltransferase